MAHMLAEINGRTAFAYNAQQGKPWHRLGQSHDGPMSVDVAFRLAQGGFDVREVPLLTPQGTALTSHKALVREENGQEIPLGVVGSDYGKIDYRSFVETFVNGLFQGENVLDTLGILDKGGRMFGCVDLREARQCGDATSRYLTFTTGHDGCTAASVIRGRYRTVCNNTLTANLNRAPCRFTIRPCAHSSASPSMFSLSSSSRIMRPRLIRERRQVMSAPL